MIHFADSVIRDLLNFVFAAYLVVLGGIGFYAWSLAARFAQLRKEMPAAENPSGNVARNEPMSAAGE